MYSDSHIAHFATQSYRLLMHMYLLPSEFNCRDNEFQCLDGKCLSKSLWCNGVPDCEDASDEKPNCGEFLYFPHGLLLIVIAPCFLSPMWECPLFLILLAFTSSLPGGTVHVREQEAMHYGIPLL